MNAIVKRAEGSVSAETMEHLVGTGDLTPLTSQQRVEYYMATCRSLGLNPLTRPFRFLKLNNQVQMYPTRDCADQLRQLHAVSVEITSRGAQDELYIVEVRAADKHGRRDTDLGAVTIGQLKGEARANAVMKAITKAKRRVTLSICGLGSMPDESEVDSIPGAVKLNIDPLTGEVIDVGREQRQRQAVRHEQRMPGPDLRQREEATVQQGQPRDTERHLDGDGLPMDLAGHEPRPMPPDDVARLEKFIAACGRVPNDAEMRAFERQFTTPFMQRIAQHGWREEGERLDAAIKAAWKRIDAASAAPIKAVEQGSDPFNVAAQKEAV